MFTDERRGGYLHIGQTKVPLRPEHDAAAMVPDVLFYDNQQVGPSSTTNIMQFFTRVTFLLLQHLRILEDMSRDFALGEHLLLVGNQGVGKNKIVDRFLYLLNLPREYLQLHRCVVYSFLMLLAFLIRVMTCFHIPLLLMILFHAHTSSYLQ